MTLAESTSAAVLLKGSDKYGPPTPKGVDARPRSLKGLAQKKIASSLNMKGVALIGARWRAADAVIIAYKPSSHVRSAAINPCLLLHFDIFHREHLFGRHLSPFFERAQPVPLTLQQFSYALYRVYN
jgi:hypothetical protein